MHPPLAWPLIVVPLLLTGCPLPGGEQPIETDDLIETADYGESCATTEDCTEPLVCAGNDTCLSLGDPGTAPLGGECISTTFCQTGLVCSSAGSCEYSGGPGTAGLGEDCTDTSDCRLGYACLDDACYGFDVPLWSGAACADDEGVPFRAIFEVPEQGGSAGDDFYRLPFPNDVRAIDGVLDLSGHPAPGVLVPLLGDVVGDLLDGLVDDFDGFGTNQAVLFRFSERLDFSTVTLGLPPDDGDVALVGLTPGSPDYGAFVAASMKMATGRGNYLCPNWIGVAPARPLRFAETYAVVVGKDIDARDGGGISQDADFTALLDRSAPTEARLSDAWDAYAPLRAWLDDIGENGSILSTAAVFTTQDPTVAAKRVRAAVEAEPLPTATNLVLCGSDPGPYADSGDPARGCHGTDAAFAEIQGTLSLPRYQQGTLPYKDRADGGAIDLSAGAPTKVGDENAPFALTIPTGAMPTGGWPLVVYGHGSGGHYRAAIEGGLAAELSEVVLDDATAVRFATLTIDALHAGPRRHEENWDPAWLAVDPDAYASDVLFYNPLNTRAARDNGLQSSAEYWSVARWAAATTLPAGTSPTGLEIRFDPGQIYYMGHSQGATSGTITVAYGPEFRGAVLSSAGGLLIQSLLHKTSPHDLPAMLRVGLAEPAFDRFHPLLNLAQMGAERSDGVNHGPFVAIDPPGVGHSVFQITGIGDTYTPNETQTPLSKALGVGQWPSDQTPLNGVVQVTLPVSANGAGGHTLVVGLYAAAGGRDAHFVLFERDDALRQATHFLGTEVRDGVPTLVAPSR